MSPRNLFNIILKVFGLFLLKDAITFIPQIILIFSAITDAKYSDVIIPVITLLLFGVFWFAIIYLFIFKTNFLITKLKLNKGFDQDIIPLNIHRSQILSICFIVIGGLLVANEMPNLVLQLFEYFREKNAGLRDPRISYSVLAISRVILGFLLIIYQRHIVNFIECKRKNKANTNNN